MLEPGTLGFITAVHLASTVGTLLVWVGEAGVWVYSPDNPEAHEPIVALSGKAGVRLMTCAA